jgi:hypothetical protein
MGTTVDEDTDDGMADEGRQLIVLGEGQVVKVSEEELAKERAKLTDEQLKQLTVVDMVRLTEDQLMTVRSDLLATKAKELIAQAARSDEILKIMDWTARYRLLAEQAMDREMEADAVEIRLQSVRRLGLMLAAVEKAKGGRPYHTGSAPDPVDIAPSRPPTLAEYGIKGKRLQHEIRVAKKMPDDEWERHISKIRDKILNPKPKSPKLETVAAPSEGVNLGIAYAVVITANKDILNHKSHKGKITRAEVDKLQKAYEDGLDIIAEVYDNIEEEGVVDVKPSSTLDLEGL